MNSRIGEIGRWLATKSGIGQWRGGHSGTWLVRLCLDIERKANGTWASNTSDASRYRIDKHKKKRRKKKRRVSITARTLNEQEENVSDRERRRNTPVHVMTLFIMIQYLESRQRGRLRPTRSRVQSQVDGY